MFLNMLPEVSSEQLSLILLVECVIVLGMVFSIRQNISGKTVVYTVVAGIVLSLLSLLLVNNLVDGFSSDPSSERFGWPISFYFKTINLFGPNPVAVAAARATERLDVLRCILNTGFWSLIAMILLLAPDTANKKEAPTK